MRIKWIFLAALILTFTPSMSTVCYGINYVCIDPGHGGSDSGAVGRVYHVPEKDANLSVGLALRDTLENLGYPDSTIVVIMTRETDVWVSYVQRAAIAMGSNPFSAKADQFLIIHHNAAWDTTDTSTNGTETWWSSCWHTPEDSTRDYDSLLAMAVQGKMVETLNWRNRGIKDGYDTLAYVLHHTTMISAYPEISFITCKTIDSLFYFDTTYARKEAGSVYRGWRHYIAEDPIIVVRNHFIGGEVLVDGIYRMSPFHGAWYPNEWHSIGAFDQYGYDQWGEPHYYQYCRWSDGGAQQHEILVGYVDEVYTACFSWGSYYVNVDEPNGGETYEIDQTMTIGWYADPGVYDPPECGFTVVDIYLSRNGGQSYDEEIVTGYPSSPSSYGWYNWTVTGPASTQCKIKIVAHDDACNGAYDFSDNNFTISSGGPALWLTSPNGGEVWEAQSQHDITWESYNYEGDSVHLRYTKDGSNWFGIVDTPNDGVYTWTLPSAAETLRHCRVKVRDPHDGFPYDISDDDFTITPGPLYAPTLSAGYPICEWVGPNTYTPGIGVEWTDNNPNELGYKIERKDSTHMVWEEVGSAPKWATSYTDTLDLVGSQTYWYRVRAYNQAGYSGYSNEKRVRSYPNPPSNVTGTLMWGNTNLLLLSWEPPENQILPIVYYRLFVTDYYKKCDRWYKIYGLSDTLCLDSYLDSGWCYLIEIYTVVDSVWEPMGGCPPKPPLYIVPGRTEICWPELCQADEFAICGDVNGNSYLSIADVVYLVTYLYSGGPPPPDPIERADANNDCLVNSADITYLINYLFGNGPLPECCWIH